jgi:hypothetical protein
VTEDWRKLHNEELHNLYYSPNNIRMVKEDENVNKKLVGKLEKKRLHGRPTQMGG